VPEWRFLSFFDALVWKPPASRQVDAVLNWLVVNSYSHNAELQARAQLARSLPPHGHRRLRLR